MTPHNSDAALVDALRAGRHDAFERLYADYHAPIYNLCARILGDREEAKDVTQDVFISAFTNPPVVDRKLKLRPWLYRVATNACLNRLRAGKNLVGGGEAIDNAPSRVDGFEQAETVALVEASLAQLNERYRTALVLKDLHGLPPAEIASVMEVSRPAADVLVHRARGAFKSAFAKLGGTAAPASLGLVLAPLTVPAALHALPPLPHAPVAVHPPAPHVAPHGPIGGLLAKIAAAGTAKVAIGAAAATLIVAGGAVEIAHHEHHVSAVVATPRTVATRAAAAETRLVSEPVHLVKTRYGCFDYRTPHDLHEIERWCSDRAEAGRHEEAGHDAAEEAGHGSGESSGHDTTEHAMSTAGSSDGTDSGSSGETSHDSSSGTSSGSHDDSGGGTTTHDSGDSGSHDSGGGGMSDSSGGSHE